MAAIHLIDSLQCGDANSFLSATLLSLSTMLHMGLPHVNVLTKIDAIEQRGGLRTLRYLR